MLFHLYVAYYFCLEQDVDHNDEQEDNTDIPPNIPPLPQSHLQALQNRTPESKGNVAKIVSQFQEAANNVNIYVLFEIYPAQICSILAVDFVWILNCFLLEHYRFSF